MPGCTHELLINGIERVAPIPKDKFTPRNNLTRPYEIGDNRRSIFTKDELQVIKDANDFVHTYVEKYLSKSVVSKYRKYIKKRGIPLRDISSAMRYHYFTSAMSESFHEMIVAMGKKNITLVLGFTLSWEATGILGFEGALGYLEDLILYKKLSEANEIHYQTNHKYSRKFPSKEGGQNDVIAYCPYHHSAVALINSYKRIYAKIKMKPNISYTSQMMYMLKKDFEKYLYAVLEENGIKIELNKNWY